MFVLTGMRAWVVQRFSAIVLLLVVPWLFISSPQINTMNYEEWRLWVSGGFNPPLIMGGFTALLFHLWVGIRDVLLDYVRHRLLRLLLLGSVAVLLFWLGLWLALILLRAL